MFGFFKRKKADPAPTPVEAAPPAQPSPASDAPVATPSPELAAPVPLEAVPPATPSGWMAKLRSGLAKTGGSITSLFVRARVDDALLDELEEALLTADAGVEATEILLTRLKKRVRDERITEVARVREALRDVLVDHLKPLERPFVLDAARPLVVMIAGVNGAGKTTSIGKLARHMQRHGASVLLAAGDTFRAAAREQLAEWGARNNVNVIAQESGDPAAVVFDAVHAAKARGIDIVIADTAGRLPTQLHLMEELRKIRRVTTKAMDGAPHEILLVIDGNTGQNALAQVKAFDDALGLTGLIVTKLDGTAKGGVLAAIAAAGQGNDKATTRSNRLTRAVPVYFIGVGEQLEDLQPFSAEQFADALLS
ncbi:MAG TPA: signal recognition particle-docking protein FtsY [Burkholderiaceae bacterium]|nr:signal recognition particle-docking protein FtsY [Burkholderiaceae bacterium]